MVDGGWWIVDVEDGTDEISVSISTKLKNNIKPTKLYA
jgi:hypothetical protein